MLKLMFIIIERSKCLITKRVLGNPDFDVGLVVKNGEDPVCLLLKIKRTESS